MHGIGVKERELIGLSLNGKNVKRICMLVPLDAFHILSHL